MTEGLQESYDRRGEPHASAGGELERLTRPLRESEAAVKARGFAPDYEGSPEGGELYFRRGLTLCRLVEAAAIVAAEAEINETSVGIGRACLRWAGLLDDEGRPAASDARIETFADVIQHSSIPEACATVGENIAD